MSVNFPGLQPSHQVQREVESQQRGERLTRGDSSTAVAKRSLDSATKEYEAFKLSQAREQAAQGAPERLAQARERIGAARTRTELDAAFSNASRSLRR